MHCQTLSNTVMHCHTISDTTIHYHTQPYTNHTLSCNHTLIIHWSYTIIHYQTLLHTIIHYHTLSDLIIHYHTLPYTIRYRSYTHSTLSDTHYTLSYTDHTRLDNIIHYHTLITHHQILIIHYHTYMLAHTDYKLAYTISTMSLSNTYFYIMPLPDAHWRISMPPILADHLHTSHTRSLIPLCRPHSTRSLKFTHTSLLASAAAAWGLVVGAPYDSTDIETDMCRHN